MNDQPPTRPPELVAASARPTRLRGDPVTVTVAVPAATRSLLERAISARPRFDGRGRVYLNVEDLAARQNNGAVYGVYLNLPERYDERARDRHHVGNVSTFGIEGLRDRDATHLHIPGMRHRFDVTRKVRTLSRAGRLDLTAGLRVSFLLELPAPPPGFRGDAGGILRGIVSDAAASPLIVGRVSVFVG